MGWRSRRCAEEERKHELDPLLRPGTTRRGVALFQSPDDPLWEEKVGEFNGLVKLSQCRRMWGFVSRKWMRLVTVHTPAKPSEHRGLGWAEVEVARRRPPQDLSRLRLGPY